MSWLLLGSSDGVSRANLQDAVDNSVFVLRNTITGDPGDQVTKADADFFVYLDHLHSSFAAKSSLDVMVKENLQPSVCKVFRVTVDFSDLSASDNFTVYFRFYDCGNNLTTISYTGAVFNENSGYCYRNNSPVDVFILVGGNEQAASFSGYNDGGYCALT